MSGIVTRVTPTGKKRKFWDSFANILGTEREDLSHKVELELVTEDYDLLIKVTPYFITSLYKQVMADIDKPYGYAQRARPKGLRVVEKDSFEDCEIPSYSLTWPNDNLIHLNYILNTNFLPTSFPIRLQANCLSKSIAKSALAYFEQAICICLTNDIKAEDLRRSLPQRGLRLVAPSLPQKNSPC